MKYSTKVIEAAWIVLDALGALDAGAGGDVLIPAELVAAVKNPQHKLFGIQSAGKHVFFVKIEDDYPRPDDLMKIWNDKRDGRLPACRALTAQRRKACVARLKDFPQAQDWQAFMKCINSSDWMLGKVSSPTHPGWKANFDWFIKPASIVKFLEGAYAPRDAAPASRRDEYGDELDRRNGERK